MGNCLKTQLKSEVQNDELTILGSVLLKFKAKESASESDRKITIRYSGVNNGYIINYSDGTKTTVASVSPNTDTVILIDNKDGEIIFKDKNLILDLYPNTYESIFNLEASTNLNTFAYTTSLRKLIRMKMYGDIKNLEQSVESLVELGLMNNNALVGDISVLSNATHLTSFAIENSQLVGSWVDIVNNNLELINTTYVTTAYSDDVSKLRDGLILFTSLYSSSFTNCVHKWETTRDSSKKIIAMSLVNFGNDLDAMLINQANCLVGYTGYEAYPQYKAITVYGTHTVEASLWQAAVTTLKEKGYAVRINGTLQ